MALDLHVHSTYSDGLLTPEALCTLAIQKQVHTLALTDHDTTEGIASMVLAAQAAALAGNQLAFIPAVELSAGDDGRTHVLGYGVDAANVPLVAACKTIRQKRLIRGTQMVEALRTIGIEIPGDYLPPPPWEGQAIGRPHIARALIRMGLVNTMEQAFDRFLEEGRPAYVPLAHLSATQAISLLKAAGAVPVLAHPMRLRLEPQVLEAFVAFLREAGLQGLEVYHPSAGRRDIPMLQGIADRLGLLATGGSDFHGDKGTRAMLGGLPGGWHTWEQDLAALRQAMLEAKPPATP